MFTTSWVLWLLFSHPKSYPQKTNPSVHLFYYRVPQERSQRASNPEENKALCWTRKAYSQPKGQTSGIHPTSIKRQGWSNINQSYKQFLFIFTLYDPVRNCSCLNLSMIGSTRTDAPSKISRNDSEQKNQFIPELLWYNQLHESIRWGIVWKLWLTPAWEAKTIQHNSTRLVWAERLHRSKSHKSKHYDLAGIRIHLFASDMG